MAVMVSEDVAKSSNAPESCLRPPEKVKPQSLNALLSLSTRTVLRWAEREGPTEGWTDGLDWGEVVLPKGALNLQEMW